MCHGWYGRDDVILRRQPKDLVLLNAAKDLTPAPDLRF
jgi:hypothetical protein